MATRVDPYRSFNFLVEIDGITQAGFQECTGLDSQTASIDFRLGDDTSRAGHGLFRTERARGKSHERFRPDEVAELRHRDTAKRERMRVVAQRDTIERAERIARCQSTRRGCDQRIHGLDESRHTCHSHRARPGN